MAANYLYNAYGQLLTTAPSISNPFQYGGKFGYYTDDNPMGVILAQQRWYSPHIMRWLSRDPIEYDGGDNLYGYVLGNPVGYVDPTGNVPLRNDSPRPVVVGGNRGEGSGKGAQVNFVLPPGGRCSAIQPCWDLRDPSNPQKIVDIDTVDTNCDGKSDINDFREKYYGDDRFPRRRIVCRSGSYGPACDIDVLIDWEETIEQVYQ